MASYCSNRFRSAGLPEQGIASRAFAAPDIASLHRSLPEYSSTPLVSLPTLADSSGLGGVLVKDESQRFGLKAFKALGATYACYRILKGYIESRGERCPPAGQFYNTPTALASHELTFCTATDGNHGRGVAWTAHKLNQRAVIYMPSSSVPARIESIQAEGAEVRIVDGTYDEAVRQSAHDAAENGWHVTSDTSWPGYEQIPAWIQAGYLTLFQEIENELAPESTIDLVIVQGGVGALAAAAAYHFRKIIRRPKLKMIAVEPVEAACLQESIASPEGEPVLASGEQTSIMAGLNCGMPSQIAWPYLRSGYDGFLAIDDLSAVEAMRSFYNPLGNDPRIISGESGAAGLAGLLTILEDPVLERARQDLNLTANSSVLILNTEGDTDPANFRRLVQTTNR